MRQSKSSISKNIKDLEYKKLLSDYNASLAATISVSLGATGISYQILSDWVYSLFSGSIAFLLTNLLRINIDIKLKNKIEEIKSLAKEDDFNTWAPKQDQMG